MRVACVGECMVELSERPDGSLVRGFGGDTLNTALYLARLGVTVDYVTALGDDPWSDAMVKAWGREGIGLERVRRQARACFENLCRQRQGRPVRTRERGNQRARKRA